MPSPDEKEVAMQLALKRWFLFLALGSLFGVITERLFQPLVWSILLAITTVLAWSADELLWRARHPGQPRIDYYRRRFWWAHIFDHEIRFWWIKSDRREEQR
ncbi:Uncharacterised protein [Burkholderia pseudomallei]|nr:Uncharacterised protein [Burkholderia pseudomallei]CAJ4507002.1 Uncharacterised protein [Burkholderia pseudomallei]CAJ5656886.1 Uncharacterised protein [Burkholderia pseudomallei]CAJ6153923.1 Uncharacterised protein [Burkholderia pseudomallei]CAJ6212010.1 Uncharacterised protein [Burkholderia pseudomallei]